MKTEFYVVDFASKSRPPKKRCIILKSVCYDDAFKEVDQLVKKSKGKINLETATVSRFLRMSIKAVQKSKVVDFASNIGQTTDFGDWGSDSTIGGFFDGKT
jgi:hypothetical protein